MAQATRLQSVPLRPAPGEAQTAGAGRGQPGQDACSSWLDRDRMALERLVPKSFFAMLSSLLLPLLLACSLANAATEEEIHEKGMEVMEEYRKDQGHWVHVLHQNHIDHMVDHLGKNGLCVMGFFVGPTYKNEDHREATRHQKSDDLFVGYEKLARDQSWLEPSGMTERTWSFGYSHDPKAAEDNGCGPHDGPHGQGGWEHLCIVVWKTSKSGKHTSVDPISRFNNIHQQKGPMYRPSVSDMKSAILEQAQQAVNDGHIDL